MPEKFVLIVEDDKFYANIYKTKLAKELYAVLVVGDGRKALEAMAARKPDLVLLDLVMPIMDGFETLKAMRADPNLKAIKVIILSNLSQEEDIKKAKQMGAVDYLVKTNMSIKEVTEKIKLHLK